MTHANGHEPERQTHGPLTLLAAFGWYIKLLFSRVSHLNREDRKYFNAVCGIDTHGEDPYSTGQVVFSTANLWPHDNKCPTVISSVELSTNDILAHFKVPTNLVLSNLVSGRDRSYRPAGPSRIAFPDIEWLLRRVPKASWPINQYLEERFHMENPFSHTENILNNLSIDGVVEAIFVAMTRAVWNKIPSMRVEGRDIPNLVSGINPIEVRETWGVGQFRQSVDRLKRCFRAYKQVDKDFQPLWTAAFTSLFGTMETAQWKPVDNKQGTTKLGHYSRWQSLMLGFRGNAQQQAAMYLLMRSKFNTLHSFPQLTKGKGSWKTSKVQDRYHVWIMANPAICAGSMAGYIDA